MSANGEEEVAAATARLEAAYPHGTVTDGGLTVGVRVVRVVGPGGDEPDRPCPQGDLLWREGGRLHLFRTGSPGGWPDTFGTHGHVGLAHLPERLAAFSEAWRRDGLDDVLRALVRIARHGGTDEETAHFGRVASDFGRSPGTSAGEAVRRFLEGRRRDASAFLATLDPVALRVALDPRHGVRRLGTDLWPGLDANFGLGAPLARAVLRAPDLARSLAHAWASAPSDFDPDDPVGVVHPVLVRAYDGDEVARHLEGAASGVALIPTDELLPLARHLVGQEDFPIFVARVATRVPDWVPDGPGEWAGLARVAPFVDTLFWTESLDRRGLAAALDARGRWVEFHARLRAAVDDPAASLVDALADVADVRAAFASEVIAQAFSLSGEVPTSHDLKGMAVALLSGGRGVCRVLAESTRWHRSDAARRAAIDALPRGKGFRRRDRWDPVLSDATVGGVTVTVLARAADLADEGRSGPGRDGVEGLSHCVGGYAGACLSGRSRVLSLRTVRDGRTVRLSTAEVAFPRGVPTVVQHRARRNATPGPACREALAAYLSQVLAGPRIDLTRLAVPGGAPGDDATYDRHHPGNWSAVRDLWAPFVPRALRTMDHRELTATCLSLDLGDAPWTAESPFDRPRGPSPAGP